MSGEAGKFIIVAGIIIVITGVVIYFFHDHLRWIGRLPGDIRVEKEKFNFYFPITTMILFSILLTIVVRVLRKIM